MRILKFILSFAIFVFAAVIGLCAYIFYRKGAFYTAAISGMLSFWGICISYFYLLKTLEKEE